MISRDTVVVGVAPRISLTQFAQALTDAKSPAAVDAGLAYRAIIAEGVDPAFLLAVFWKESRFATDPDSMVVIHDTKNPGNCRSSRIGVLTIEPTEKGDFVRYSNWVTGWRDAARRMVDPLFNYARAKATTIGTIIPIWAPASDRNDPAGYSATVVSLMNRWIEQDGSSKTMALKIAISSGHHNSDGGSPVEYAITGPLCESYAAEFKALGCDVRVITPDGPDVDSDPGDGMFGGGLQDVAAKVVEWANAGWTADLYLETHTQGLGDTSVRGAFAIYPDWGTDIDLTVKNGLGLAMVKALSAVSGIPVWSNGIMSEKATGVGISGYRLGIFLRTAPVAASTTRLIIEHGAHSNPQDLAILQNPDMQQRIASASAKAAVDYLQGIHGPRTAPDPLMDYYNAHGGEAVFGKPVGGQYGTNGSIERDFTLAHLYIDKATGKPVAEMKDRTNPQGFDVGPGIYSKAQSLGLRMITNEQFFLPASNQPGLGKMSRAWAQDSTGKTLVLMASEQPELAQPGRPTPWKVEVLEVK